MNHLGNSNKMVSDTPRTDAEYERLFEIYQNAERINGPLCCAFENDMRLCRQLERELNAANERIKQLEDARTVAAANSLANMLSYEDAVAKIKRLEELGNKLRECASQLGWTSSEDTRWIERAEAAVKAWDKESKP